MARRKTVDWFTTYLRKNGRLKMKLINDHEEVIWEGSVFRAITGHSGVAFQFDERDLRDLLILRDDTLREFLQKFLTKMEPS